MKAKSGYLLALALGVSVAANVQAQAVGTCDVVVSTILANGQLVLKANCSGDISGINWLRDIETSLTPGGVILNPAVATGHDVLLTINPLAGTHRYSATGASAEHPSNPDISDYIAGKSATVIMPAPTLTIAPTPGGTVVATPAGSPAISACANGTDSNCSAEFTTGAIVTLTATPDGSHSFAGWGGDCTGSAVVCALAMTNTRTVSANFGPTPVPGACAVPPHGDALATQPSAPLCANGTASAVSSSNNTWVWTCSGLNGSTGTASCAANQIINGACGSAINGSAVSSAPSANLCSTGTATAVAAATANNSWRYTWSCNGINGGTADNACFIPAASTNGVCATITNTLTTPPSSGGCTAGAVSSLVSPATAGGNYTWTCSGTAGGSASGQCSAAQTINGACGSASGLAVLAAPSSNLCVAGTSATAVSGTGPWTWGCNGVNSGTSTPATACSAPVLTGGCGATPGEFNVVDWPGYTNSTQVYIAVINPNSGVALRFTPSSTAYPKGVKISDTGSGAKVYNISTCPGDITNPVDGQDGRMDYNGDGKMDNCKTLPTIHYPGYNNATYLATQTTCWLSSGTTYYLNIKNISTTASGGVQLKNSKLLN